MIYFNNVSKLYENSNSSTLSLDNVSLAIGAGEFVSIVGHSGAGKSTFIKLIMGEEYPTDGTVFFESVDVHRLKRRDLIDLRRRIGTVFQDFRLLPDKTAYENVAFAMEVAGREDNEIGEDVPHVLDLVGLSNKAFHFPHQLSGGEKQRLAIARAIINQPELIIADEPTGNLDPVNTYEIIQILKKINDLGTTVILTTHNRGIIDSIKKRVITLENGKVVRDDKVGKYVI
ncbi:MAG: cell division ATP-binding protein FtsE [Candidatus Paceibacterota bacterium]|jgi:cell division transport system ATP-binding protein